jgi:hypothetical protein
MGDLRQHQHQKTKATAPPSPTGARQDSVTPMNAPELSLGNQALGRLLQAQREGALTPPSRHRLLFKGLSQELQVQPKLKLTQAGDRHEQQADRAAARVVQHLNAPRQTTTSLSVMPQMAVSLPVTTTGGAIAPPLETAIQQERGRGQPISKDVREPLEQAFGTDFSRVRIHTDENADRLNHSIRSVAFTTGKDIFFKQGAYQPRSRKGQTLLAHELTHILQQNSWKPAIQRQDENLQSQQLAQNLDTAALVKEVAQEIKSFSAEWLQSQPHEIEFFPGLKVTVKRLGFNPKNNNILEIEGGLALKLGSEITAVEPKGELKISYDFQTKTWDYNTQNIQLKAAIANILTLDAKDIKCDRQNLALTIATTTLKIPDFGKTEATATKLKIDQTGIDWDKADISIKEIGVGDVIKLQNFKANIGGKSQAYKAELTGKLGLNLGDKNVADVKTEGEFKILHNGNNQWDYDTKNINLSASIAKILTLDAKNIEYDRKNPALTVATTTLKIPDFGKTEATATKLKIDQTGIDWDKADISIKEIGVGDVIKLQNFKANIGGKSQAYKAELTGKLGLNLGDKNVADVKTEGEFKILHNGNNQWDYDTKNINLSASIAKILTLDAKNIEYDRKNPALTVATTTLKIPDFGKTEATATKLKIDQTGIDWDKADISIKEIGVGDVIKLQNFKANIGGKSQAYKAELTGKLGLNLGDKNVADVKTEGEFKILHNGNNQWDYDTKNINLSASIAKILTLDAKNIEYDRKNPALTVATTTLKIPDFGKTEATATKLKIDQTGIDWDKADISIKEIGVGDVIKLQNFKANIGGKSQAYKAELTGKLGLNLGDKNVADVKTEGEFKILHNGNNQWDYDTKNINLSASIAKILTLDAKNIEYDRKNPALTVATTTLKIPDFGKTEATATKLKIDQTGIDWDKADISIKEIGVGDVIKLQNFKANIGGKSQAYKAELTGKLGLNLGDKNVADVKTEGEFKILHNGNNQWDYDTKNINLSASIAKILTLDAKNIEYDRKNPALTVATTTLKIPDFGKTEATATKLKIDQTGIDWDKADISIKEIGVGDVIKLQNFKANIGGKSQAYKAELTGKLGLNLGDKNVADVKTEGEFKILHNGNNQWDYDTKNINLTANVASIFNLDAKNIEYDRKNTQLKIQTTNLTISALNNTKATVSNAKIDTQGIDWDTATVTLDDTSIGHVLTIRKPKLLINGRQSGYSSTASGSVELKLGKYFSGTGKGAISLTQKNANSTRTLKIDSLELTASGSVQFPGDLMVWPKLDLSYPIVPGAVETGISLEVGGSIGASLTGSVKKEIADEDWNVAVNPEIQGSIFFALKGYAGAGTSYIAAIDAFLQGKCTAIAAGGLKINGKLGYDGEARKVDVSKLLSEYYAKAEFKVAIAAGVQATALYFFNKNLYRIRGELTLGGGSMKGKLEFDNDGSFKIGKPEFEGVLCGKLEKESIKLERSYDVVDTETAEKLLKDAAKHIPGSGKERNRIITQVRTSYIRVLEQSEKVVDREQDKSSRYAKKLAWLDVKLSRYEELAKLARDLEANDAEGAQLETNLSHEIKQEKVAIEQQKESELARLNKQQADEEAKIERQENEERKRSTLEKAKDLAKSITSKYKKLKDKVKNEYEAAKNHIPEKYRAKYNEIDDKYEHKKAKLKAELKYKKDQLKEKSYDVKQQAKQKFSGTIEKVSTAKIEASALKTKASEFKNKVKEYAKEKTLTKLTELGIKKADSFVKRMTELAELQEKYTTKYKLHQDCLNSAIASQVKAKEIIANVDLAIENLQQLEMGKGVETIATMNCDKISLMAVEAQFEKEAVKLEDTLIEQVENIEKEILEQSS